MIIFEDRLYASDIRMGINSHIEEGDLIMQIYLSPSSIKYIIKGSLSR
jgi:hypothetical protein